jgi:hypothetical protein
MNGASQTSDKNFAQNQNNTTTEPANSSSDCKTLVHLRLHGGRTTMTIRVLPDLKDGFTRRTRELGLNTCHVAEGLIKGWLYGVEQKTELVHQSPTINLTLVRDVKRVRRYAVEKEEVEVSKVEVQKCAVCGNVAYARTIDVDGVRFLCRSDFAKARRRLLGWKVLNE